MTSEVASTYWEYIGSRPQYGYWKKHNRLIRENILEWADWFKQRCSVQIMEDWYSVTGKQIEENSGVGFFTAKAENSVNQSVYKLMMFLYPEYPWKPYKFIQAPQGYWKSRENRLLWFQDFLQEKGLVEDESLYRLTSKDFEAYAGCLHYYGDSILRLLEDLVPSQTWFPWRLDGQVPKKYWNNVEHIRYWFKTEFNDLYGLERDGQIQYTAMYALNQSIIHEHYGAGVLTNYFRGSMMDLLSCLFPEYNWQFWKFTKAPQSVWCYVTNILKFLKEELYIEKAEDLYKFNISDMPSGISNRFLTMFDFAKHIYPSVEWDKTKFPKHGYSLAAIRFLDALSVVMHIEITHAMNGGEFKIPGTRYKADGFISSSNTVIEYHGCYYHGCPDCYPNRSVFNKKTRQTHEENYIKTQARSSELRALGYNVIDIWECKALTCKIDDFKAMCCGVNMKTSI
jgi:G:T-mismatch repair DNA endonuclease (very short patch repair protein)